MQMDGISVNNTIFVQVASNHRSLLAFKILVENKILKPTRSVHVFVMIEDFDTSLFPVKTCGTCEELLQQFSR